MRKVKAICSCAVAAAIGAIGVLQPVEAQVANTLTLTVGHYAPSCLHGYSQSTAGSLSPQYVGALRVYALAEDSCNNRSVLTMSSLVSFPWQSWFDSLNCGTFVLNRADAHFSSITPQPQLGIPGYGSWTWTLPLGFTFLPAGTVVTCTITHF
jgi:hypothetical protein